jgi:orotate phosphoribosyltransferase
MGETYDGNLGEALRRGLKPMLHSIVLTEKVEGINLSRIARFYINSLYFPEESPKVRPRGKFSIEPRFALGQSKLAAELAPIAAAKLKRHKIEQLCAPGWGGVCALMCFAMTGAKFNWALGRIDEPKKKRILTAFDGYLERDRPVWITDDLLASGNAALKAITLLREHGFKVGGFIPVVADLAGNTGARAFETVAATMRFKFDYLIGVRRRSHEAGIHLATFSKQNAVIYDS